MTLLPLPALTDNDVWLLHDGQHAIVVDPAEAAPVLDTLRSRRLTLRTILVTHHPTDHVGGMPELRARGEPTLPSTLARERDINPFLRSRHPAVVRAVTRSAAHALTGMQPAEVETFAALRQWKNEFR